MTVQDVVKSKKSEVFIGKDGKIVITDRWQHLDVTEKTKDNIKLEKFSIPLVDFGYLNGEEGDVCIAGKPTLAFYIHGCPLRCADCYQPDFFSALPPQSLSEDAVVTMATSLETRSKAASLSIVIGTTRREVTRLLHRLHFLKLSGEFSLPVVYNYSGLLTPRALGELADTVQVFLPDLKAVTPEGAARRGLPSSYPEGAKKGIAYLLQETEKKVVVRHLLSPSAAGGCYRESLQEAKAVVDFLALQPRIPQFSILKNYKDVKTNTLHTAPDAVLEDLGSYAHGAGVEIII